MLSLHHLSAGLQIDRFLSMGLHVVICVVHLSSWIHLTSTHTQPFLSSHSMYYVLSLVCLCFCVGLLIMAMISNIQYRSQFEIVTV